MGDSRIGFDLLEDCRRAKGAAGMALSDDLRERVVGRWWKGACRAARRPNVWGQHRQRRALGCALQDQGRDLAGCDGGDRRSGRIEAHRDYLLGLVRRRPDMTLLETQERLIGNCGERFSSSVLWRFFDRHELTFKNVWPAPSARGFCRDCRMISLLQRIRPRGTASGQDGDTRADMIPVDRSPL